MTEEEKRLKFILRSIKAVDFSHHGGFLKFLDYEKVAFDQEYLAIYAKFTVIFNN